MSKDEVFAVILPTLNERANLETLLPNIIDIDLISFIVIVDDNSTDGSLDFFKNLKHKKVHLVQRPSRMGIGSAHLDGLIFARGLGADVIITMDADGTHRVEDLVRMLQFKEEFDVLVGSRYLEGGAISGWAFIRILLTKLGHLATYLFFGSRLDMSSGMRAYKTRNISFEDLKALCPSDYSFFFVSLLVMKKSQLRISQIPIILNPRSFGKSKMTLQLMSRGVVTLFKFGLRIRVIK
jgi:dolichol-phosphate mannosyltransferase